MAMKYKKLSSDFAFSKQSNDSFFVAKNTVLQLALAADAIACEHPIRNSSDFFSDFASDRGQVYSIITNINKKHLRI